MAETVRVSELQMKLGVRKSLLEVGKDQMLAFDYRRPFEYARTNYSGHV